MIKIIKAAGDSANYVHGIPLPELGINVSQFSVRYFPEVNEPIKNRQGSTFLRGVSKYFSRQVRVSGEITETHSGTNYGLLGFTLGAVVAFANTVDTFGGGANAHLGNLWLDEASVELSRRGWRSLSITASSSPWL